jgi:hypothetical protein
LENTLISLIITKYLDITDNSKYLDIAEIFWIACAQIVDESSKGYAGSDKWIPFRLLILPRNLTKTKQKQSKTFEKCCG